MGCDDEAGVCWGFVLVRGWGMRMRLVCVVLGRAERWVWVIRVSMQALAVGLHRIRVPGDSLVAQAAFGSQVFPGRFCTNHRSLTAHFCKSLLHCCLKYLDICR